MRDGHDLCHFPGGNEGSEVIGVVPMVTQEVAELGLEPGSVSLVCRLMSLYISTCIEPLSEALESPHGTWHAVLSTTEAPAPKPSVQSCRVNEGVDCIRHRLSTRKELRAGLGQTSIQTHPVQGDTGCGHQDTAILRITATSSLRDLLKCPSHNCLSQDI